MIILKLDINIVCSLVVAIATIIQTYLVYLEYRKRL